MSVKTVYSFSRNGRTTNVSEPGETEPDADRRRADQAAGWKVHPAAWALIQLAVVAAALWVAVRAGADRERLDRIEREASVQKMEIYRLTHEFAGVVERMDQNRDGSPSPE
ncbi:MAG: hypothetical protein AB7W06_17365 [Alphaproteobacteria bacterium]